MKACKGSFSCFSKSSIDHYSPCPLKLEDVRQVSSSPSPVSIVLDRKLSGGKTKKVIEKKRLNGEKVGIFLKSSLKKPAVSGSIGVRKRRVIWMDFVGKELAEIREFKPHESIRKPTNRRRNTPTCSCIIL